ncbi:hypothetical protein LTR97_010865 [Elasticomyces elasticus]|uniref:Heterokaryon incompatibility domain-containing protein n=1 Tax=Elasticomyces elasticus TaxID=574655 RepID=A0AAN7ZYZ0_9PEZI|nr:hypothetical protein LTR97_010865 [Elasticomyces elasticus]
MTTADNETQMQQGIPWVDLSKVFQNAITVCRRLGIDYLWIDSLCIIQGDHQDWELEAPKMCDYYEHAWFTLSAASSSHGQIPFLTNREDKWSPHEFIGDTGVHFLARRHAGSSSTQFIENFDPVAARGWCWQEVVLSTRVLHYTQSQFVRECRSDCIAEDGAMPQEFHSMRLTQQLSGDEPNIYNKWHDLVNTYSSRRLTYESDRLPALSGVASKIASITHSDYLAGLWKNNLLTDLCWSANYTDLMDQQPQFRGDEYLAPSWAWPSVRGSVIIESEDPEQPFVALATVQNVHCTVPGLNPYGKVTDGYLEILAPLTLLIVSCGDPNDCWSYTIGDHFPTMEPMAADCVLTLDNGTVRRAGAADTLSQFSVKVPCILHGTSEGKGVVFFYVMVLRHLGDATYTRIGFANLDNAEWFGKATQKTIRVV